MAVLRPGVLVARMTMFDAYVVPSEDQQGSPVEACLAMPKLLASFATDRADAELRKQISRFAAGPARRRTDQVPAS